MPADDLSGISGLDDRRRDVLAQKLGITTYHELIMADRRRIADAFGRRAIRPTLVEVTEWQDEARRIRAASIDASVSAAAASGWQSAATFVVAFEERGQGDSLERRIVAEQTEIEPEASPQQRSQWPEWRCDDACRWMLERVGAPPAPAQAAPPRAVTPQETATPPESHPAGSPAVIEIERADLADSSGGIALVAGSRPLPQTRLVWHQPAKLAVTLGTGPAVPGTAVVLQLAQPDRPKHNIAGRLDAAGQVAEVELSGLAAGQYWPTIVASAPGGSLLPRVVKLPAVELAGQAPAPGGLP